MDLQKINPYIRRAIPSVLATGAIIHRRVLFDYELIYVESGEMTLTCDEVEYPCRAGQFLLIRPGVPHSFGEIHAPLSQPHIHFDMVFSSSRSARTPISFRDRSDFTAEERELVQEDLFASYPTVPYITFRNEEAARRLFYDVVMGAKLPPLVRKAHMLALLDLLIADNFPAVCTEAARGYDVAQQVKEYLDAGQGSTASLDELAGQFNYSKYHLERQFTRAFGESVIAYRNRVRMDAARRLLAEQSVTAVAERLGYTSVYVFSRAFAQRFGYPPSKEKRKNG